MVMVMLMALLIGILQSWNLKAVGALCNERHDLQVRIGLPCSTMMEELGAPAAWLLVHTL